MENFINLVISMLSDHPYVNLLIILVVGSIWIFFQPLKMKKFLRNTFNPVFNLTFVVGLPVTILSTIVGCLIIFPWSYGIVWWQSALNTYLIIGMLTTPTAVVLSLYHPTFRTKKEQVETNANMPPSAISTAVQVNKFATIIYETKMDFIRFYEKNYTKKFRISYGLLNFVLWMYMIPHINLVWEKLCSMIILSMSYTTAITVAILCGIHWTANQPEHQ